MELLGEHNRLVREAIRRNNGFEVKTEGDAFMVAFTGARDALRCAIDMQKALRSAVRAPRSEIADPTTSSHEQNESRVERSTTPLGPRTLRPSACRSHTAARPSRTGRRP